jgi:hypothetical protein
MAPANFWFCTMISSSAFVEAYRYSVPIATSARSATCCVVTPSTPCSAKSSQRARPDAFALVLLRPLPAADRHPSVAHDDLP